MNTYLGHAFDRRLVKANPVESRLVHALGVLFELALAVRPQALDVGREMRHVGHPSDRPLIEGRGVQSRLGTLKRKEETA